jgi:MFS family permease
MAEETTTAELTRTTAPASTGNLTETSGEPWLALTILLVASFMGVLDVFIVNVAVPSIQSETNASFADIQLIIAGYTLAYSVGLVTGGRLGDAFGRRRIFLGGTALFGLASVGCSIAPDATTLIVLRVLQGLSAAVMLPQVLALIQIIFTPANRARRSASTGRRSASARSPGRSPAAGCSPGTRWTSDGGRSSW